MLLLWVVELVVTQIVEDWLLLVTHLLKVGLILVFHNFLVQIVVKLLHLLGVSLLLSLLALHGQNGIVLLLEVVLEETLSGRLNLVDFVILPEGVFFFFLHHLFHFAVDGQLVVQTVFQLEVIILTVQKGFYVRSPHNHLFRICGLLLLLANLRFLPLDLPPQNKLFRLEI